MKPVLIFLMAASMLGQATTFTIPMGSATTCPEGQYLTVDGRCLHDRTGETFPAGDGCNTVTCTNPNCRGQGVTSIYCVHGDDPASEFTLPAKDAESLSGVGITSDVLVTSGTTGASIWSPVAGSAHYRHHGPFLLPDHTFTPGAVNPEIVADPSGMKRLLDGVEVNICTRDFRTAPFRKVDEARKQEVCLEYGITSGCPGPKYEIDHVDSLEIGGSDELTNLWPQPIAQARFKDYQVEDRLPKLICSGKITLKDAQDCAAQDWVSCGERIVKLKVKRK